MLGLVIGLGLRSVFWPRDCSLARLLLSCRGWMYGLVSVTFVYYVERSKDTAVVAVECE